MTNRHEALRRLGTNYWVCPECSGHHRPPGPINPSHYLDEFKKNRFEDNVLVRSVRVCSETCATSMLAKMPEEDTWLYHCSAPAHAAIFFKLPSDDT